MGCREGIDLALTWKTTSSSSRIQQENRSSCLLWSCCHCWLATATSNPNFFSRHFRTLSTFSLLSVCVCVCVCVYVRACRQSLTDLLSGKLLIESKFVNMANKQENFPSKNTIKLGVASFCQCCFSDPCYAIRTLRARGAFVKLFGMLGHQIKQ